MADRFVARSSPVRIALLLAGSLIFVVLGLWMAGLFGASPRPDKAWIGWVCVLFFGLAALVALRRVGDRREQIVVDDDGVWWRQWSETKIPWAEIRHVAFRSAHRQRFLCLFLADPSRYPPSTFLGRVARMNKALGFGDIAINATGTDRSADELAAAVERFSSRWR